MDDIEEIKKLKARYFRALDAKDWDLYASLFTEDFVADFRHTGHDQVIHGRDNFLAYVRGLKLVQSVHQGHMPEIELTSPTAAAGVWSFEDYNLWEDGTQNHGWGHYLETYEKKDGRWRIKTQRLSYLRIERPTEKPVFAAGKDRLAHLRGPNPALN